MNSYNNKNHNDNINNNYNKTNSTLSGFDLIVISLVNEILHNMIVCESVCKGSLVDYTFVEQCKKNLPYYILENLHTCIITNLHNHIVEHLNT